MPWSFDFTKALFVGPCFLERSTLVCATRAIQDGVRRHLLEAAAMHVAPRQAPFGCATPRANTTIVVFALGVGRLLLEAANQPRSAVHSLHATARLYIHILSPLGLLRVAASSTPYLQGGSETMRRPRSGR